MMSMIDEFLSAGRDREAFDTPDMVRSICMARVINRQWRLASHHPSIYDGHLPSSTIHVHRPCSKSPHTNPPSPSYRRKNITP